METVIEGSGGIEVYIRVDAEQNSRGVKVNKAYSVRGTAPMEELEATLDRACAIAASYEALERARMGDNPAE